MFWRLVETSVFGIRIPWMTYDRRTSLMILAALPGLGPVNIRRLDKALDGSVENLLEMTSSERSNWCSNRVVGELEDWSAYFDPDKVSIAFDDVMMVQDGLGLGAEAEEKATEILKQQKFSVTVDLQIGQAAGEVYTCDLSLDYVKINADYRT